MGTGIRQIRGHKGFNRGRDTSLKFQRLGDGVEDYLIRIRQATFEVKLVAGFPN